MLSDAGSPEMYPGVQQVIELLDSVLDDWSSRSPKGVIDEEEFDLTECTLNPNWRVTKGQMEDELDSVELDDSDSTFSDDEIEQQLHELANTYNKANLAASASFAAKALQYKAESVRPCSDSNSPASCDVCGCNEVPCTGSPLSLCQKHEDLLIDSVRKDFRKELLTWPAWLQRKVQELENIELTISELHQVLCYVAVPKLKELKPRTEEESNCRRDMLKAIATYKTRFDLLPGALSLLMTLSMTILFAFGSDMVATFLPAAVFSAAAGTALMAIVVGVGTWRSRALTIPTGYAAMIGAGCGMLSLGLL